MKIFKYGSALLAGLLLLTACNQPIQRDAQYQMGDMAIYGDVEFGISSTAVTTNDDGEEVVVITSEVINTSNTVVSVTSLDSMDYYTPTGTESEYVTVFDDGELNLLPGQQAVYTAEIPYANDGTYYLSFEATEDSDTELLYAFDVTKDAEITKALPQNGNPVSELTTNVQKGQPTALNGLEFTFLDTSAYTSTGGYSSFSTAYSGIEIQIKNTTNVAIDLSDFDASQIIILDNNTVEVSSSGTRGSDTDDVVEYDEVGMIQPNGTVTVTLILTQSYSNDAKAKATYIEIENEDQMLLYRVN